MAVLRSCEAWPAPTRPLNKPFIDAPPPQRHSKTNEKNRLSCRYLASISLIRGEERQQPQDDRLPRCESFRCEGPEPRPAGPPNNRPDTCTRGSRTSLLSPSGIGHEPKPRCHGRSPLGPDTGCCALPGHCPSSMSLTGFSRAAPRPRIRSLGQAFDLASKRTESRSPAALVAVEQVRSRHLAIPIDRMNAHQHCVYYVSRFSGAKQH